MMKKQQNKKTKISPDIWLFGKHATFTALAKKRRKILRILVTKNSEAELRKTIQKNNLTQLNSLIKIVDVPQIEAAIGKDQPHQGIALLCSKLPTQNQFDLLDELYALTKDQLPNLLLLDQVCDPQNIGAIIRSAVSFGVKKIVFCEHNAPKENATIAKASVGTIEEVDIVIVTNFSNLMEKLKKIGYWCVGLDGQSSHDISTLRNYDHIALIVGSEGKGIRDLVKKNCDILIKINIDTAVESLNASVATSIALYEMSSTKSHL